MCGIAGIVEFGANEPAVTKDVLKAMSDVIVHRGPDSEGQFVSRDRKCGLAFRRLSIIDLSSAGDQPMHSPDGRYTIVFNGEIYNHAEIRRELIQKGYEYRSQTDTETILYGWREFGKDIVNKLRGMWAFSIWDRDKQELFCARDRIGIKPFYYTKQNGRFIFGSEIKSILQHPAVSTDLNEREIPNYLNYGMSGRSCLFKDIVKLSPGNCLLLDAQGNIKIERYWSPMAQNQAYTKMDAKECQDESLRILREAVNDRMMSDVPFGVFLSGGVDSSLNVALMAELMDRPIDSYTVGFKELEKYNELEYARKVSKLFHTNHHEILIDEKDAFPILQELTWYEDEPNADPVCIPLWFLSKLTRESGTTVIQVGEGSDEQFVGYSWMLREYNFYKSYWKFFTSLPQFARKIIFQGIKPILKKANQLLMLDYFRRATENDELYWGGISIMSPSHLDSMLSKDFLHLTRITAEFAGTLHDEARSFHPEADFLQRALYVELSQRLSEILLMRVDKIGMAHSIEARVPFLDHRLVEFTMSIPPSIKTPDNKLTKNVLKKAVEPLLPKEIIYRKKMGFWAPVNEWIRTSWFDYTKSVILDSGLMKRGIFNEDYLKRLLEIHRSGKQNKGLELFSILSLALWHKKFFE